MIAAFDGVKAAKGCRLLYFRYAEDVDAAARSGFEARLIGKPGVHRIENVNKAAAANTTAARWRYAHVEGGHVAATLEALQTAPQIVFARELYNMLCVTAAVQNRSELAVRRKGLRDLGRLEGVFSAVSVPHMQAMDQPGEVSFNAFVPQDRDAALIATSIAALKGVKHVAAAGLVHI